MGPRINDRQLQRAETPQSRLCGASRAGRLPIRYRRIGVDAADRGIAHGDRIRIFNERGSVELGVRLDNSLRPGCIVVHNGWWLSEGGGINLLSAARETDMGHGSAFHDNAVEVERSG